MSDGYAVGYVVVAVLDPGSMELAVTGPLRALADAERDAQRIDAARGGRARATVVPLLPIHVVLDMIDTEPGDHGE